MRSAMRVAVSPRHSPEHRAWREAQAREWLELSKTVGPIAAAKQLGVHYTTVWRTAKRMGLETAIFKPQDSPSGDVKVNADGSVWCKSLSALLRFARDVRKRR